MDARIITILLIDDHALCRDGLRYILQTNPRFRIVGEAASARAAVPLARVEDPDVILLDAEIPDGSVAASVHQLRSKVPRSSIIVLSFDDDTSRLGQLLRLGVRGYLNKSIGWEQLAAAVTSIANDPHQVVVSVSAPGPGPDHAWESGQGRLSGRESEVLALTALAMSNGQIARRLSLTEATVKRHLHSVFRKLEAVSRLDAVNKARQLGLIGQEPLVARPSPLEVNGLERGA